MRNITMDFPSLSNKIPYSSLLDPNFYSCVRANDICQIHVIEQLDFDRDQLGYLGIRTGGRKAAG